MLKQASQTTSGARSHNAAPPKRRPGGRDRYIDSLRCMALVRVMIYHTCGWIWLPIMFPSMGVMFALAGSLMAVSLDKSQHRIWSVLFKRSRRLLPPLWAMALILVPIMLFSGWSITETVGNELSLDTLWYWIVPVSPPPGSAMGADWVLPLWYISAYFWFLLLSPALLWLYRHWPRRVFLVPLCGTIAYSLGIIPLADRGGDVVLRALMFGSCWVLGFAYHDGHVAKIPLWKVLIFSAITCSAGLMWATTHPDPVGGANIDDVPLADCLYSVGYVVLLLRLYRDFSWMSSHKILDGLVAAMNRRAMTIYLWGNLSIALAISVLSAMPLTEGLVGDEGGPGLALTLAVAWIIVFGFVCALGWVEDVAAQRPASLTPWPKKPRPPRSPRKSGASFATASPDLALLAVQHQWRIRDVRA